MGSDRPHDAGGRRAVVTGGASGIGLATAARFATDGWETHVIDIAACPDARAIAHVADVSDEDALEGAVAGIPEPVAALVCAAGIWDTARDGGPRALDLEAWRRTLAVNLTGTMLTVRALLDRLADDAAIVTVASVAGLRAMPHRDAYTASKGAVIALTRSWAVDFSRKGIRVNCVCPGPTRTPMIEDALSASAAANRLMDLPQQRAGEAAEIAEVIAFLASPRASYLSGAVIPVDGGASAALAGLPFPVRR